MHAVEVLRGTLSSVAAEDAEIEALDRLARLVDAAKSLLVVRAGPTPVEIAPYYRAIAELNEALAAVLGEEG